MSTIRFSAANPKPRLGDDTRPGADLPDDMTLDAFPSESTLVAVRPDLANDLYVEDFPSESSLPIAIEPSPPVTASAVAVAAASHLTRRPHQRQHTWLAAAALIAVVIGATLGLALPNDRTDAQTVASTPAATALRTVSAANEPVSAPHAPAVAVTDSPEPVAPVNAAPPLPAVGRASAPTSQPLDGQIRIATAPAGARVTIDGIGWGETPVTASHLTFGTKTIRLTRDGYASVQVAVSLSPDRPTQTVNIPLRQR